MGDPVLGGSKGLPPPELGFIDWVKGATKAAKAKYSDASLIDVTAIKKASDNTSNVTSPITKYDLLFQARYSSFDDEPTTVIVTGKDYTITTSGPQTGTGSVSNFDKVKDPYPIWRDNSKLQTYDSFKLYGYAGAPSSAPKGPTQPYYGFTKAATILGTIGAFDGKSY